MDYKALGYVASMISVLALGAVAWPKPGEPDWQLIALVAGMALSIVGIGLRWVAHVQEKRGRQP